MIKCVLNMINMEIQATGQAFLIMILILINNSR